MARHAATTKVPVSQTRSEIDKLIRGRDCDALRWTDHYNDGRAVLEFTWTPDRDGSPLLARFEIVAGDDGRDHDQEWRRIHRVLRVFLLGLFEAVDAGLISLEEAVLPWIVSADGRTVSQNLVPRLQKLPATHAHALLGSEASS